MPLTLDEVIEKTFTQKVKYQFLSNIRIGLAAFQSFIDENKEFLDYPYITNFMPLIRAYAITRQFAYSAERPECPYTFSYDEILPYKYKISFIHMEGAIVTLAKTHKPQSLPNKSKYKMKLAKANAFESNQCSLFDSDRKDNTCLPGAEPYYFLITYGVVNDTLTHARIIVPSKDFQSIEANINLLDCIEVVEQPVNEQDDTVAKIKKELLVKLKER